MVGTPRAVTRQCNLDRKTLHLFMTGDEPHAKHRGRFAAA
jgi:hypothetical protein